MQSCGCGFVRHRGGSTALEFALLALPFSLLVFAILEICVSFAGQQVLANAADDVARQLRTGQVRASAMDDETLKRMICDRLEIIVAKDCPGLVVDLKQYDTFAEAARVRTLLTEDNDLDTAGFEVKPGPALSKNMLRVFYKWPVMIDFLSRLVADLKGGRTLHFATVTWQNEPFED